MNNEADAPQRHNASRPSSRRGRRIPQRIVLTRSAHAVGMAIAMMGGTALAMPGGEEIIHGQVSVTRPNPTTLVVTQGSHQAAVNWNSFDLATHETAQFRQPSASSSILNYIVGANPSTIAGSVQSNGQVIFVNPHGVHFTPTATVDVGGLVASTHNLSLNDYLSGKLQFEQLAGAAGFVRNDGRLTAAPGGFIALLGTQIENNGTLAAPGGSVGLAAGGRVKVDFDRDGLITFQVDPASAIAKIVHAGTVIADGGRAAFEVKATDALRSTVLNSTGVVQARGLVRQGNQIVLSGGDSGVVNVSGKLDASGVADGAKGGDIRILGRDITVGASARIDASGAEGGGNILIGGDLQGGNPLVGNAFTTTVARGAQIRADSTSFGDGGRVIVWADDTTRFAGEILARAGARGGNGGFAEVSGKRDLYVSGQVDLRSESGVDGTLLLDPGSITIGSFGSGGDSLVANNINASFIAQSLATANVIVTTAAVSGDGVQTITVNSPISWTNDTALTLAAQSDVRLNAAITSQTGRVDVRTQGAITGAGLITAATVVLEGDTGVGTSAQRVNVATGTLAARAQSGNVFVLERDGVTLDAVDTVENFAAAAYDLRAGSIEVSGDIQVSGDVRGGSSVSLTSSGRISGTRSVIGSTVVLSGTSGVGGAAQRLSVASETLAATATAGSVFIAETDGVSVRTVGQISNIARDQYDLTAAGISIEGDINATSVVLTASAGSIVRPSVSGDQFSTAKLTAGNITLRASQGSIGSVTAEGTISPIVTSSISAESSTTLDLSVGGAAADGAWIRHVQGDVTVGLVGGYEGRQERSFGTLFVHAQGADSVAGTTATNGTRGGVRIANRANAENGENAFVLSVTNLVLVGSGISIADDQALSFSSTRPATAVLVYDPNADGDDRVLDQLPLRSGSQLDRLFVHVTKGRLGGDAPLDLTGVMRTSGTADRVIGLFGAEGVNARVAVSAPVQPVGPIALGEYTIAYRSALGRVLGNGTDAGPNAGPEAAQSAPIYALDVTGSIVQSTGSLSTVSSNRILLNATGSIGRISSPPGTTIEPVRVGAVRAGDTALLAAKGTNVYLQATRGSTELGSVTLDQLAVASSATDGFFLVSRGADGDGNILGSVTGAKIGLAAKGTVGTAVEPVKTSSNNADSSSVLSMTGSSVFVEHVTGQAAIGLFRNGAGSALTFGDLNTIGNAANGRVATTDAANGTFYLSAVQSATPTRPAGSITQSTGDANSAGAIRGREIALKAIGTIGSLVSATVAPVYTAAPENTGDNAYARLSASASSVAIRNVEGNIELGAATIGTRTLSNEALDTSAGFYLLEAQRAGVQGGSILQGRLRTDVEGTQSVLTSRSVLLKADGSIGDIVKEAVTDRSGRYPVRTATLAASGPNGAALAFEADGGMVSVDHRGDAVLQTQTVGNVTVANRATDVYEVRGIVDNTKLRIGSDITAPSFFLDAPDGNTGGLVFEAAGRLIRSAGTDPARSSLYLDLGGGAASDLRSALGAVPDLQGFDRIGLRSRRDIGESNGPLELNSPRIPSLKLTLEAPNVYVKTNRNIELSDFTVTGVTGNPSRIVEFVPEASPTGAKMILDNEATGTSGNTAAGTYVIEGDPGRTIRSATSVNKLDEDRVTAGQIVISGFGRIGVTDQDGRVTPVKTAAPDGQSTKLSASATSVSIRHVAGDVVIANYSSTDSATPGGSPTLVRNVASERYILDARGPNGELSIKRGDALATQPGDSPQVTSPVVVLVASGSVGEADKPLYFAAPAVRDAVTLTAQGGKGAFLQQTAGSTLLSGFNLAYASVSGAEAIANRAGTSNFAATYFLDTRTVNNTSTSSAGDIAGKADGNVKARTVVLNAKGFIGGDIANGVARAAPDKPVIIEAFDARGYTRLSATGEFVSVRQEVGSVELGASKVGDVTVVNEARNAAGGWYFLEAKGAGGSILQGDRDGDERNERNERNESDAPGTSRLTATRILLKADGAIGDVAEERASGRRGLHPVRTASPIGSDGATIALQASAGMAAIDHLGAMTIQANSSSDLFGGQRGNVAVGTSANGVVSLSVSDLLTINSEVSASSFSLSLPKGVKFGESGAIGLRQASGGGGAGPAALHLDAGTGDLADLSGKIVNLSQFSAISLKTSKDIGSASAPLDLGGGPSLNVTLSGANVYVKAERDLVITDFTASSISSATPRIVARIPEESVGTGAISTNAATGGSTGVYSVVGVSGATIRSGSSVDALGQDLVTAGNIVISGFGRIGVTDQAGRVTPVKTAAPDGQSTKLSASATSVSIRHVAGDVVIADYLSSVSTTPVRNVASERYILDARGSIRELSIKRGDALATQPGVSPQVTSPEVVLVASGSVGEADKPLYFAAPAVEGAVTLTAQGGTGVFLQQSAGSTLLSGFSLAYASVSEGEAIANRAGTSTFDATYFLDTLSVNDVNAEGDIAGTLTQLPMSPHVTWRYLRGVWCKDL